MSGGHPFSTDRSKVKTVALMIAFENISIFIVILTLLCAFGSLVIALLYPFSTRERQSENKNAYPV